VANEKIMTNPYFSIIIPTHNRSRLILDTLRSLQVQTFRNFECVIVDDGGSDDTADVVASLDDARFKYIWKEHGERGAARNHGTKNSAGDYVYFLDSDDFLAPDGLRIVHNHTVKKRPPVVISRVLYKEEDGKTRVADFPYGVEFKAELLNQNYGGGYAYLRRDVAENVGFHEHKEFSIAEDWDLALRLAARYDFDFSPTLDRVVLLHDSNSMKLASPEKLRRCAELLETSLRSDQEFMSKYGESLPNILAEVRSLSALHAALVGRQALSRDELKAALKMSPKRALSRRTLAVLRHGALKALQSR
jgi:glycosyltransferase involved in cell wall biosynthesis